MAYTYSQSVYDQQVALNKLGAGLKTDGYLGPLTQAAITKYASTSPTNTTTLKQGDTFQGGIVNYDAQTGAKLAPGATTTITSASLAPSSPLPYVSPTTVSPYPVATLATPALTEGPQQQKASALSDKLQSLYDSTVGESAYRKEQNDVYGVDAITKTVTDLGGQLTGLKNEAAAIPLQLQQGAADRGVTTPVLGRQENSRLRTNAIAALGVSSLLSAAQGNLATAKAQVESAVAQKYDPIKEQIAATIHNLQLVLNDPKTTLEEKNQAQAQLDAQYNQKALVQAAEQNMKDIYTIASSAASNGKNFIATAEYPSLALALQAITQAQTKAEALQIASAVGLAGTKATANSDATLLTPNEAKTLGVPYGTTRGQASTMGIIPKAPVKSTGGGGTVTLKQATSAITKTLQTGIAPSGEKVGAPRGADGYVDPYVYLAAFQNWIGTPDSFLSKFPVKTNINPQSYSLLPQSIQPTNKDESIF